MRRPIYRKRKSVGLAWLFSLIWPGFGQIYLGHLWRGLFFLIIQGAIVGFSGIPQGVAYLIMHKQDLVTPDYRLIAAAGVFLIYNLYDAVRLARRINRPRYIERGM